MSPTILLPTDGNPAAAAAIALCMQQARDRGGSVVGLYVLPADDLSVPEDDSYLPEGERPGSVVRAGNALRAIEEAAAAAGVPCTVLARCAESPLAAMLETAAERQCGMLFLGALRRQPDAAALASLRRQMALADSPAI